MPPTAIIFILFFLGLLGCAAFLIWLIVASVRKKPKKVPLIGLGVSIAVTVISYMVYGWLFGA